MPPTRAVVASATVTGRRALSAAIAGAGVEVVGASPDARTLLARVQQHRPEVVVVDVDVELETVREMLRVVPRPTVFVATGDQPGRDEAARSAGGTPLPRAEDAASRLRTNLAPTAARITGTPPVRRTPPGKVELVAIGASTGGPAALATLLQGLPGHLPVPVVLVQHMPANFTRVLAARLDASTGLVVREAQGGEHPKAGEVWVAPGDRHLTVARDAEGLVLNLNSDAPECFCRPSVDVLFRSIASTAGGACLAVVLTGMGQDGLRGATLLKEAGATVLTQDELTSVVWGMPGYITRAGLSSRVLPIDEIASEILSRLGAVRGIDPLPLRREIERAP